MEEKNSPALAATIPTGASSGRSGRADGTPPIRRGERNANYAVMLTMVKALRRTTSTALGGAPLELAIGFRLEREQPGVCPAEAEQLPVRALLGQRAVLDHVNAIGHAHGGEPVADEHGHALGH